MTLERDLCVVCRQRPSRRDGDECRTCYIVGKNRERARGHVSVDAVPIDIVEAEIDRQAYLDWHHDQ